MQISKHTYNPEPPSVAEALRATIAEHPHPLVFASTFGSKLYGFDTPASDRDIRGSHIIPLDSAIGLDEVKPTITWKRYAKVNVEVTTHDVKKYLFLLLNHNATIMEELLSPLVIITSPWHLELQEIAPSCITTKHAQHYISLTQQAINRIAGDPKPDIKNALHMYRAALTGVHLMRTGQIITHLPTLNEEANIRYVNDALQQRKENPGPNPISPREASHQRHQGEKLVNWLRNAAEGSQLPTNTTAKPALNDLLLRIRKATL